MRDSQSQVRLFTFGVGDAVHGAFLRQLSSLGRGQCTLVSDGPALEEAAARLARETARPLAVNLRMVDRGLHIVPDSLVPTQPCDLFASRPLLLAGRRRGEGDVILQGDAEGQRAWSLVATPWRCATVCPVATPPSW